MRTPTRRAPLLWWGGALLAAGLALGLLVRGLGNGPFAVDVWWREVWGAAASGVPLWTAVAMDRIGGGWIAILVVPLGGAALLFLARRRWAAVCFLVALATSAVAVQLLKTVFGRARPDEILIAVDVGSFPSGHVANAATLATVLWLLFPRAWILAAGIVWTVLMALSRTYLGAHWASDTLGGALVGAGVALLVAAVFAGRLRVEGDASVPRGGR